MEEKKILFKVVKTLQKWFLYIVNEPSLGLFYIQTHFMSYIEKLIEEKVKYLPLKKIKAFDKIFIKIIFLFRKSSKSSLGTWK